MQSNKTIDGNRRRIRFLTSTPTLQYSSSCGYAKHPAYILFVLSVLFSCSFLPKPKRSKPLAYSSCYPHRDRSFLSRARSLCKLAAQWNSNRLMVRFAASFLAALLIPVYVGAAGTAQSFVAPAPCPLCPSPNYVGANST